MKLHLTINQMKWTLLGLGMACAATQGVAQNSYTILTTSADAFLSGANPTLNYGAAGTLAIAPASSPKGAFDSAIEFNTAAAVSQFNTTYGMGDWTITGLTLSLASNYGIQGEGPGNNLFNNISGGLFGIDWLASTSWMEGTGGGGGTAGYPNPNNFVTFDSISGLLGAGNDSLGTYTYTPAGNNNDTYQSYSLQFDSNMASAAAAGAVSLYFYAADNQVSYLFNSRSYASGHPELTLTAEPTPEPSSVAMGIFGLGALAAVRRRKK